MRRRYSRRRKTLMGTILVLAILGLAAFLWLREPSPDTRFTGAYRTPDGELLVVVPYSGDELRLEVPLRGERRPLLPAGDGRYTVGTAGTPTPPSEQQEITVSFETSGDGDVEGVRLRTGAEAEGALARRIDLPERRLTFASDGFQLAAKLVLPPADSAPAPYPAVVLVHGSGKQSAVDFWGEPYLFAPHGVATLVYDKRGTGASEGTYTQNFHVLARDVRAAVDALRERPDIDPDRIHLAGFSQGGWIAPLAAVRDGGIRSVLVGYGPMVPIVEEDRWGYVYTLRKKGFGDDAIAEADRLHELIVRIIDHGEDRWEELARTLDAVEDEPWFQAAAGSDSTIGFLSANRWVPLWAIRIYAWSQLRPIDGEPRADRLYDPVPVVAELEAPSLWIFGGDDHSMPTGWTVEKLERLRAEGAPIEVIVYPRADHGIALYEKTGDGERRFIGYEPSYQPTMVDWLRRQSGLEPLSSG